MTALTDRRPLLHLSRRLRRSQPSRRRGFSRPLAAAAVTAVRRLIALTAVVVTAAALSIGAATTALATNPPPAPGTGWTTVFDDNYTGPAGSAPSYNWMY